MNAAHRRTSRTSEDRSDSVGSIDGSTLLSPVDSLFTHVVSESNLNIDRNKPDKSSPLSRSNSRSNSPTPGTPTRVGMAARKFLARTQSSSSVDTDDTGADSATWTPTSSGGDGNGGGGNKNNGSKEQPQLSPNNARNKTSDDLRRQALTKSDYNDDSFEFENLQRLSEMNLAAVESARDVILKTKKQSHSARGGLGRK